MATKQREATHIGMLEYMHDGKMLQQRVRLYEDKATYLDVDRNKRYNKKSGGARPASVWIKRRLLIETVMTVDEARCIEHDNITFLNEME